VLAKSGLGPGRASPAGPVQVDRRFSFGQFWALVFSWNAVAQNGGPYTHWGWPRVAHANFSQQEMLNYGTQTIAKK
jgi:hypothetical protein